MPAALLWLGDARGEPRRFGAAVLAAVLFEDLHPGRDATFTVARAIALVAVVVAQPIDQDEVTAIRSAESP